MPKRKKSRKKVAAKRSLKKVKKSRSVNADTRPVPGSGINEAQLLQEKRDRQKREDFELIGRAVRGEQKAYKELMNRYRAQIYALMYRMVHSAVEAEDLVQEAFMKAFGSLPNFNYEYAFSTWLYKIATNNCIDHLRKKKLQTFSIDAPVHYKDTTYRVEIPDFSYHPEKEMMQSERNSLIKIAIEELPEKYKQVIYLRHTDELSYEEIAALLKIPIGTVKARIFRAREILNRFLKGKVERGS